MRQATDLGLIKLDLAPTLGVVDTHLFNELNDLNTRSPAFFMELLKTTTRSNHRFFGIVEDTVLTWPRLYVWHR